MKILQNRRVNADGRWKDAFQMGSTERDCREKVVVGASAEKPVT